MLIRKLPHFWKQILAKLEGNLIRSYSAKTTSSFSNKILIEPSELDRLKQCQLRDYLPKLQAMARQQTNIRDIMARKNLSAEERLNIISALQIKCDKLNKANKVLNGILSAQAAPAQPQAEPAVLPKILAAKGKWTRHRFGYIRGRA